MDIAEHLSARPSPSPRPSQQNLHNDFDDPNMPPSDDPMIQMMQQLLGGAMNDGSAGPNALPPGFANLLSGAGFPPGTTAPPGGGQQAMEQSSMPTVSAATWRLMHALLSLLLALVVTVRSPVPFTGSRVSRELADLGGVGTDFGKRLFIAFASMEVVLQSSRYFMEKGQLQGSGILGTLTRLLPEPWAGYVRVVGRYGVIFSTIVSDALVIVFALGMAAWWNGGSTEDRI
jgi:GET complex subunit GET2